MEESGNFKLAFKNISYRVDATGLLQRTKAKTILNGVSGEFRGNELTAIVGLSGSGKSSLLDCLSGFRRSNITGAFFINGIEVSVESIKQVSSYFMQEQALHPYLTVSELMNFSLSMKGREELSARGRKEKIEMFLTKLSITHRSGTLIKDLSGGEKKRLQIAIELVSDPKILFLDEPTTSLDSVASAQCIEFLKALTRDEQKTIICTIHQPSASVFRQFDHIYALASGNCIYQGSSSNLIGFLEELNLPCPPTYNPADFLLEIANNDYGNHNGALIDRIQNGTNLNYRKTSAVGSSVEIFAKSQPPNQFAASYFQQVYQLMSRIFLTATRNRSLLFLRFGLHIVLGVAFGFIYKDIGRKGSMTLDIYRFCIISVSFLLYTSYHSLYATFPLEFPIVKREHFNRWYSSRAYFTAMMLFDAPIILCCCTIYVTITFLLTDQPLELERYLVLLGICLIMSYAAQSLGIMFTALMDIQMATTFGTIIMMPFFLFSSFIIFAKDTHPILIYFFDYNFVNTAFKGAVNALLGLGRRKLACDQLYCHYSDPKKVLRDFEMNVDLSRATLIILVYFILAQVVSYALINHRLKHRHS